MSYKVMGIAAGRKDSNGEILLKEALSVCAEAGAEVTFINLRDYNILDCTGCTACTKGMFMDGKNVGCVLGKKDDKDRIMQALFEQDALIFSVPTYDLQAALLRPEGPDPFGHAFSGRTKTAPITDGFAPAIHFANVGEEADGWCFCGRVKVG